MDKKKNIEVNMKGEKIKELVEKEVLKREVF